MVKLLLGLILVNKSNPLNMDYVPSNLRKVNIPFASNEPIEKTFLTNEAATAIEDLYLAALANGLHIKGLSGYRSYHRQAIIYQKYCSLFGEKKASRISAQPGMSEHQTGLAIDVSCATVNFELNENFGNTPEGKWLNSHCHEYGFIIRYPQGKEHITGYSYEPWHLRYVGIEVATKMYENHLVLEEYSILKN